MKTRLVKRDNSFQGNARFNLVLQYLDSTLNQWEDLISIDWENASFLFDKLSNKLDKDQIAWEDESDQVKYRAAENYEYGN